MYILILTLITSAGVSESAVTNLTHEQCMKAKTEYMSLPVRARAVTRDAYCILVPGNHSLL